MQKRFGGKRISHEFHADKKADNKSQNSLPISPLYQNSKGLFAILPWWNARSISIKRRSFYFCEAKVKDGSNK